MIFAGQFQFGEILNLCFRGKFWFGGLFSFWAICVILNIYFGEILLQGHFQNDIQIAPPDFNLPPFLECHQIFIICT